MDLGELVMEVRVLAVDDGTCTSSGLTGLRCD